MPCLLHHAGAALTRRQSLGILGGAAGAALVPSGQPMAALFPSGVLAERMLGLFEAAGGGELGTIVPFTVTGKDLPWGQKLMDVHPGQQVTFLLTGRWHLAREIDLWFEPGVVFHARVDQGPMFNPNHNTGTLVADRAGRVEIARSAGEWANANGEIWTPLETYQAADGEIEGVAIAWKGEAAAGLNRIHAEGDVGGLIGEELRRLSAPAATPPGWRNHFSFGEAGIFRLCGEGQMCCETQKNVAILQRDIAEDLKPGLSLSWRWLVNELPSRFPENDVPSHDYLSIGVEFDDGQDITYFWSVDLPVGTVFRCPLPGWNAIETHVVQRSGRADLGTWLSESRDITKDYADVIGGDATRAVRIWLLGVSVFQRLEGSCRYADIALESDGQRTVVL